MTRPIHASDVKNLRRCLRMAALARRTERQPPRAGSAAAFGTLAHRGIEDYVARGIEPDPRTKVGRVVAELAPHVPAGTLGAEVPFVATWRGIALAGTIDLVARGVVIDWKTIGEWSRMLGTLAGDPQATIYSYAYAQHADPPELRWVYVHTRSINTRVLIGRIDPSAIGSLAEEFDRLLDMDGVSDPLVIPGNRAECTRYGGCTFLSVCGPPSPAERIDLVAIGRARRVS